MNKQDKPPQSFLRLVYNVPCTQQNFKNIEQIVKYAKTFTIEDDEHKTASVIKIEQLYILGLDINRPPKVEPAPTPS